MPRIWTGLVGNYPVALYDAFNNGRGIGLIDASRPPGRLWAGLTHDDEYVIADREWQRVRLPAIGQQDARTRDVNLKAGTRNHELGMTSRAARDAVRRFHCHYSSLYRSDAPLYNQLPGRERLPRLLGLGGGLYFATLGADEDQQEQSCR